MLELKEKKEKRMIFVKEPYEFIKGRYNLNLLTLKVLSYLFTKIDPLKDKEFTKYEITIKEISNILQKDYGNIYEYIKNTFRELIDIKIELEDETDWKIFTILVDPTILKKNGTISFYVSPNLLELLKRSKHYLKYDISILAYFNSAYALRLYKILKDKLETNIKYNITNVYDINIEDFRKMLFIPNKYLYGNIKQKVLNKALEEINLYADIKVSYEEIKKGRKVQKLRFFIEKKDNNLLPDFKPEKEKKKENITPSHNSLNALKKFRTEILTNYNNQEKYFLIEDNNFAIKENLLFLNDKPLSAAEALKWWKYIYKNKDQIKEINIKEEKEKAWKEILEELNKIYTGKRTLIGIGGEYADVEIVGITGEDLENLKVTFKRFSNNKLYTAKYTLEGLKGLF